MRSDMQPHKPSHSDAEADLAISRNEKMVKQWSAINFSCLIKLPPQKKEDAQFLEEAKCIL